MSDLEHSTKVAPGAASEVAGQTSQEQQARQAPPHYLDVYAAMNPHKTALICGERSLTYAELNVRANRVANMLLSRGARAGDRVALMAHNSIEGIEVAAGVGKASGVIVLLNYRLQAREVAYIIQDCEAKVMIADPELVPIVEQARQQLAESSESAEQPIYIAIGDEAPAGWLRYEELLAASDTHSPPPTGIGGSSMSYTSGTTGYPKGAYRPSGVPLENILAIVQAFQLSPNDVHLMAGPYYHSAPSAFTSISLNLGATVVIMPKFDAVEALRLIDRHGVTTTFMAPTLLHRLCDVPAEVAAQYNTRSLRSIILGGASCPYVLKVRAIERFGECLWEFYGATETSFVTILRPEDQLRKPGSCGKAGPGQEILLLNEQGQPVPDGTPGELWARSTVLAEYYNKPDATASRMHDGFFTVGDIAYRDDEGYYYICDRKIDMIISGGVNIYPAEIEAVLTAHPAVADVAVIGVPDDTWGESVKAVVQLQPGASASASELIAFCAARLADYKKPRSVDFVDELPRNPAGKLLKNAIRAPYWANSSRKI
jgi:acyl-CoA synthetase (AMP-forming)/AMP-acid ligase II